jgi:polyhydroxybutyrate depolymerase
VRKKTLIAAAVLRVLAIRGGGAQAGSAAQDVQGQILSGGRLRTYRVFAPSGDSAPWPVMLVFHGGGGTGEGMERLSGLDAIAGREGFLAVYPDGYRRSWADGRGTSAADAAGVDDVGFVRALLDQLETDYSIDPSRVYATGLSNGALFAERLGCDLSDRISGIAPVAGPLPAAIAPDCAPAEPVSVLLIHGTEDPVVPYGGGEVRGRVGGAVLSAQQTLATWAAIDGCVGTPQTSNLPDVAGDGTAVSVQRYADCAAGSAVSLYTVAGGGHTWPGGEQYFPVRLIGRTSSQFNAGDTIWQFFVAHPRTPDAVLAAGE